MPEPGFEKIDHSDQCLFGPRKLLLCGFTSEAQSKFRILLEMLGLGTLPAVWIQEVHSMDMIGDLIDLPHGWGAGQSSTLPRAIIVSGISQKELHQLMTACRKAGMRSALWAALTPTSIRWSLQQLLIALSAEHRAMSAKMAQAAKQQSIAGD